MLRWVHVACWPWALSACGAVDNAPGDDTSAPDDAQGVDGVPGWPQAVPVRPGPVWPPSASSVPAALDLSGAHFDEEAGSALRSCTPIQRELNPPVLHAAPVDLDGDGVVEVVLGNLRCLDEAGGSVDDPVARWNAEAGRLVIAESFSTHVRGPPTHYGPAMTFLDVDGDGDADLVGTIPDPLDASRLRPVWWNDGAGTFSSAPLGASLDGRTLTAYGAFGLATDASARVHLWMASRAAFAPPDQPTAPTDVTAVEGRLEGTVHVQGARPDLAGAWSWTAVSTDPTQRPFEYLFATVNPGTAVEDFHWGLDAAAWAPDDFIDAARGSRGEPVDAVLFAQPMCGTASPTCFTPMGGSMLRLPTRDEAGGPAWRDCAGISTGSGIWPVFVACPEGGRLLETGGLVSALQGPAAQDIRLAWQVSGTWDVNADGYHDVIVTNGRDAEPYPAQPNYAYLRRPGCFDDTCGRYALVEWPIAWGHHHGFALVPVPRSDGGWTWLGLANSNAVDPVLDARVAAFVWSPTAPDGWVSLGLGALHDLRGMGAVVTPTFVDAAGATVAVGEPTLVSLASTRGHPGVNQPLVWGLPVGATGAFATVEPPGDAAPYEVALTPGVPAQVPP